MSITFTLSTLNKLRCNQYNNVNFIHFGLVPKETASYIDTKSTYVTDDLFGKDVNIFFCVVWWLTLNLVTNMNLNLLNITFTQFIWNQNHSIGFFPLISCNSTAWVNIALKLDPSKYKRPHKHVPWYYYFLWSLFLIWMWAITSLCLLVYRRWKLLNYLDK